MVHRKTLSVFFLSDICLLNTSPIDCHLLRDLNGGPMSHDRWWFSTVFWLRPYGGLRRVIDLLPVLFHLPTKLLPASSPLAFSASLHHHLFNHIIIPSTKCGQRGLLGVIGSSRRVGWSRNYPTFGENMPLYSRNAEGNVCEIKGPPWPACLRAYSRYVPRLRCWVHVPMNCVRYRFQKINWRRNIMLFEILSNSSSLGTVSLVHRNISRSQ